MGYSDSPEMTDAAKILANQASIIEILQGISARQDQHAEALNGLGTNLQWIFDQAAPLLSMMGNPQMMGMMSAGMAGAMGAMTDGSRPGED